MSKTGWKKLPEDVRAASILQAAACCFLEKGYHSASMQDVARAAGLTKGGLYHHFASKEAIRDALIMQFLDFGRLGITALQAEDLPADVKLVKMGDTLLAGLATKRGSAPRFMAEAIACSGDVPAIADFYADIEVIMVDLFQSAQQGGLLKFAATPKQMAGLYMALIDGLQIHRDLAVGNGEAGAVASFIAALKSLKD